VASTSHSTRRRVAIVAAGFSVIVLGALWSGGAAGERSPAKVDDELEAAPAIQPSTPDHEPATQERAPERLTKAQRARRRELAQWRTATAIVEENRRYLEADLTRVVLENLEHDEGGRLERLYCHSPSMDRARRAVLDAQPRTFHCFFTYSDQLEVEWAPYVVSHDGENWHMKE
jgi:hypothetical protein